MCFDDIRVEVCWLTSAEPPAELAQTITELRVNAARRGCILRFAIRLPHDSNVAAEQMREYLHLGIETILYGNGIQSAPHKSQ